MRIRRILLLSMAFIIFGAVTVLANDSFQWYKAKSVKVVVNDKTLKTSGLLMSGDSELKNTTMLPVRELAGTLQALVNWDSKAQTVTIYKPNVHISLVQGQGDGPYTVFGQVAHKLKINFKIFAQIDSITTKLHAFKLTIVDPTGQTVYESEKLLKEKMENIWHATENINLEFKELGDYTVKVFMKINEKDDYSLVSEKVLQSIATK